LYILLHFLRPISAFLRKMIGRAVTARPEGRRKICAYAQGEHMSGAAAGHAATDEMSWDMRCTTGGAEETMTFPPHPLRCAQRLLLKEKALHARPRPQGEGLSVIILVTDLQGGASMPARKNSKKRQVILEALAATTAHPTAQELYQQLKPDYPDLSLGTVYRNLSLFAEEGDAISDGVFRGQERFDARTNPHAHLHCVQCGRVIDVPLPGEPEAQLCALAQGVTDAQVLGCSITFTGLCKTCQQADKGSASE